MKCYQNKRTLLFMLQWCLIFFIPLLIVHVQTDEVIVDNINNEDDETLLVSDSKPKNDFLVNDHVSIN